FRPGAEPIEVPALLEDLGEFGNLDKTMLVVPPFENVQTHREFRVGRFNDDQVGAQILGTPLLLGRNELQQVRRRIAVKIEIDESAIGSNILAGHVAKQ